jgi:predicted nucleic acid-binding protein
MIVVDSSALVDFLTDDTSHGDRIRGRIRLANTILAPYLLDIEFFSALLGMARGTRGGKPKLTKKSLNKAVKDYTNLPLERKEQLSLFPRIQELSSNLSAYDATYVALAESYHVPFITCDTRIERSKVARCVIETFG